MATYVVLDAPADVAVGETLYLTNSEGVVVGRIADKLRAGIRIGGRIVEYSSDETPTDNNVTDESGVALTDESGLQITTE